MNLKEVNELIGQLDKNNESLLADFYRNKRRQLIEKIRHEIDKKIWDLVK